MKINNRRYVGSKYKLMPWIKELIDEHCSGTSFFDVFAGTGVVTDYLLPDFNEFYVNDFLLSNEVIYNAFFGSDTYDADKLKALAEEYCSLDAKKVRSNYVSKNYGDKYFAMDDAKLIGYIRENIQKRYAEKSLNHREYCLILTSLIYSMDRCANTVGHYEAYFRKANLERTFRFELVEPSLTEGKTIHIFREDSNELVRKIKADIAFVDPPYNSRQYSRFYHVLENIVEWKKPALSGTAMKPEPKNMSDYCRNSAPQVFDDLIQNLDVKYIVVTYNNTYNSKSSSSRNKILLEEIEDSLNKKGRTSRFEMPYRFFNAGKTDLAEHKELVFITEVGVFDD